jgi:hypothetical protein
MNTIRQLAMQWSNNLLPANKDYLMSIYYNSGRDFSDLTGREIENIFYNEVILKWWNGQIKIHDGTEYRKTLDRIVNENDIKEMYLERDEQPLSVNKDVEVDEEKTFEDFEEWIVVRLAETGFKGFNFDETKEIVDKAMESREKRKVEVDSWDEAHEEYLNSKITYPTFYDFLQQHYTLTKKQ